MATLKAVFFVLSIYLSGVFSNPHLHHMSSGSVTQEKFVVNVELNTAQGKPATITWEITQAHRQHDPNIENVAQRINQWASGITTPGVFTGTGFLGLSIDHSASGMPPHTFKLPKCTEAQLGKDIIRYTSGNALPAENKTYLMKVIDACL